jgi:hypothetical protein
MADIIGFDRIIKYDWIDRFAWRLRTEKNAGALRQYMQEILREECPHQEARRKNITVLQRIWVNVKEEYVKLRDEAVDLLEEVEPGQRTAIHWGMSLLAYPFFADVADNAGRLLALQGEFTMAQAKRRLVEKWGQRPTLERAYRRVIRSMVDWGVLLEGDKPGNYAASGKISLELYKLRVWLLECCLKSLPAGCLSYHEIHNIHVLFPFQFEIDLSELLASDRFDIERMGLNMDLVKAK